MDPDGYHYNSSRGAPTLLKGQIAHVSGRGGRVSGRNIVAPGAIFAEIFHSTKRTVQHTFAEKTLRTP